MSQIVVDNNKIVYKPLNDGIQGSFTQLTGPNLFGKPLSSSVREITLDVTWYSPNTLLTSAPANYTDFIQYHITGTITKDIADGIIYYQISSTGPNPDPTIMVPANPYSDVDTIDLTLWQASVNRNQQSITARIIAVCQNENDSKKAKFRCNFVTSSYCY